MRAQPHHAPRAAGFSLLEVLIALGILGFGLLGLVAMQMHAMREGSTSRYASDAGRIARDQMEQIQRMPFAVFAAPAGLGFQAPPWINVAGFAPGQIPVQVQTIAGAPPGAGLVQVYNVAWNVSTVPGDPNLFNVDVEVTWVEPHRLNAKLTRTGLPTVTLSSVRYNW